MTPRRLRRPLALAAMLAAMLAAALGAVAALSAAQSPRSAAPRPIVIFVHGRGNLDRDSVAVRTEWERALRMGARELETGTLLEPGDMRLVWYADVLDPASDEGCRRVTDGPDVARLDGDEGSLLDGARFLLGALAAAVEEPDGRREARGIVGDLMYLADPWKRCGVERRLARALADAKAQERPVVLVSHSLGAAIAYRHLRAAGERAPQVRRWVTLGAPLADAQLRALLLGDPDSTALRVPRSVRSWVNVVREGDPFAAALAPLVPKGAGAVTDLLRRSGSGDPHDLGSYLKDPEAARAIVWAWCDAFRDGAAPKGCGKVGADVR